MRYADAQDSVNAYRQQMLELRQKIRETIGQQEPQPVDNYEFQTSVGVVSLDDLFGTKETLFVVHNMGQSCSYCTLWADGLNGVIDHLRDRAAFVLASPDSPAKQKTFAESRGWRFTLVSHKGSSFNADMGYAPNGGNMPGISVFQRNAAGGIVRVSDTAFGPGDDFCAVWSLFDLIPEGPAGWEPQYSY